MHITCRQPTVLSKEGKERRAIKMELKNVDITEGYVRGIKMLNTVKEEILDGIIFGLFKILGLLVGI